MLSYSSKNNLVRIMLGVFLIIHAVYLFVIWRLPKTEKHTFMLGMPFFRHYA